jgi:hypothetical protein
MVKVREIDTFLRTGLQLFSDARLKWRRNLLGLDGLPVHRSIMEVEYR